MWQRVCDNSIGWESRDAKNMFYGGVEIHLPSPEHILKTQNESTLSFVAPAAHGII